MSGFAILVNEPVHQHSLSLIWEKFLSFEIIVYVNNLVMVWNGFLLYSISMFNGNVTALSILTGSTKRAT